MLRRIFKRKPKPSRVAKPKRETPAAASISSRLLGVEGLGFFVLAIYTSPIPPISEHEFRELWIPALFTLLAFLGIFSALGVMKLRPLAWNMAMLVQGISFLLSFVFYLDNRPFYSYLQMLVGIIIVLNLNQSELRRHFSTELIPEPVIEETTEDAPEI
ncbi:MAG: hypothetical protein ACRDFQ_03215 [Anaerolineales bacterium]